MSLPLPIFTCVNHDVGIMTHYDPNYVLPFTRDHDRNLMALTILKKIDDQERYVEQTV